MITLLNRAINAILLVAVVVLFLVVAVTFVVSVATGGDNDPHGYAQIFGVVLGIVLLLPLTLLGLGALALRRGLRAGFGYNVASGILALLVGFVANGTARAIAVGLGVTLAGLGVAGLLAPRRSAPAESPPDGGTTPDR